MKEKILAAIKAKFPKVNLSKVRLNAIADKIITKVIDDETKIDAAIDEFNDFNPLAELAKQDDTIRNLEAKVKQAAPAKPDDKPDDKPDEKVDLPDDTPAYVKKIMEKLDSVTGELAIIKGEKVANTIKDKATELLKEIPVSYWGKRAIPDKVEDLEAFVEEVKTDYTAFTQEITNKGLEIVPSPGGGDIKPTDTKKASDKEIESVVNEIM